MILNREGLKKSSEWQAKGYQLPGFDIEAVKEKTRANPMWIHFGAGNIFKAFLANGAQQMLNRGELDRGIIVAEGFDYEIVEKMNRPHDELCILATLKSDGTVDKTVIASIAESCILDSERRDEMDRLREIFASKSLQLATFTITEKGYSLTDASGAVLKGVEQDFANGPEKASSYMGKVAALLYHRYINGKLPVAMVSTDNCSHNGDKLKAAVLAFADEWEKNSCIEPGFAAYVSDKKLVSFPWTMIDKITPRPDASVEKMLKEDGVEGLEPVITSKNTYVAPFVNAEETEYLVIEDSFPNGREAFEKAGFFFTDAETVDKVERMKVCTCLNPLHTALAIYGCLLGYNKISEEMKDAQLKKLVERIGYVEGLPVVVKQDVLDPKEFIDAVLQVRLPNPFMPDSPQRIATDTSQKLGIRFGETVKKYIAEGRDMKELKLIPLVFAGWLRYLQGIDDNGESFERSQDPMLDMASAYVQDIDKNTEGIYEKILPLLKNEKIFGTDLEKAGLSKQVCEYFMELLDGKGAVRRTLLKYTA